MNKDVFITIRAEQDSFDGEPDGVELFTSGTYNYGKDGVRLSYMESEITGLDGTKTMFHVKPGEVVLSRRGSVNSRMVFHPGKSSNFFYSSEYGMMQMELDTLRMKCALDEHGGDIDIEYNIDLDRSLLSRNRFTINVREKRLNS